MHNFFSMDGLPYKVATVIYNLMALSFLWFIFSIPIITIGASTTALFYVVGKIIRVKIMNSIRASGRASG